MPSPPEPRSAPGLQEEERLRRSLRLWWWSASCARRGCPARPPLPSPHRRRGAGLPASASGMHESAMRNAQAFKLFLDAMFPGKKLNPTHARALYNAARQGPSHAAHSQWKLYFAAR